MAINMAIVPAQLRMLFINVISLFWTYKLSTMSSAAPPCDAQILELTQQSTMFSASPACDAQFLELTQQDTAVASSASCVADILGDMPEEFTVRPPPHHCLPLAVGVLRTSDTVFCCINIHNV